MFIKRLGSFFLDIIEVVVFAIAIFLFIYLLILQPHKIKGASMEPNFLNSEYLLTDKVTYRFREPKRGDVVVFEAPSNQAEEFIKRIVGEPNEVVAIKDGSVYVNNKKLKEPYLPDNLKTYAGAYLKEGKEFKIPEDHFMVLGDNRNSSSDSRTWGFVSQENLTGRAWFIYWPVSQIGVIPKVQYSPN